MIENLSAEETACRIADSLRDGELHIATLQTTIVFALNAFEQRGVAAGKAAERQAHDQERRAYDAALQALNRKTFNNLSTFAREVNEIVIGAQRAVRKLKDCK